MPAKPPKPPRLIGYARVSTEEQGTDHAAGCAAVFEEHACCARSVPARPGRAPARPPRPLGQPPARRHRAARGERRPFPQPAGPGRHHDAAGDVLPGGALGAVAQLERALIAERTKAGLSAARLRGRVGGNPGLRAGDPDSIRKIRAGRDPAHLVGVLARLGTWLPIVRRMQPD
jgi:hypothetical protein